MLVDASLLNLSRPTRAALFFALLTDFALTVKVREMLGFIGQGINKNGIARANPFFCSNFRPEYVPQGNAPRHAISLG